MGADPDKEKDSINRYPTPPKMPSDVLNDPAKRKLWEEYWQKVREEWTEVMKESKRRGEFNDRSSEIIRKRYKDRWS